MVGLFHLSRCDSTAVEHILQSEQRSGGLPYEPTLAAVAPDLHRRGRRPDRSVSQGDLGGVSYRR